MLEEISDLKAYALGTHWLTLCVERLGFIPHGDTLVCHYNTPGLKKVMYASQLAPSHIVLFALNRGDQVLMEIHCPPEHAFAMARRLTSVYRYWPPTDRPFVTAAYHAVQNFVRERRLPWECRGLYEGMVYIIIWTEPTSAATKLYSITCATRCERTRA